MINSYEIKNINGTEVLYLYIDLNSEFGSFKDNKEKLEKWVRDFIKKNKIFFAGTIVTLIAGGVFICNIDLKENKIDTIPLNSIFIDENYNNLENEETLDSFYEEISPEVFNEKGEENISVNTKTSNTNVTNKTNNHESNENHEKKENSIVIENKEEKQENIDNSIYVKIKRNNEIISIELEEYVIGVVGAEMPAAFETEALKAQAVIARTYALKALSSGKVLTDNNSTQNYKNNDELREMWKSNYNNYFNKIKNAVSETKGQYLSYNGEYIEAVYHSTSNGMTEDASNVWGNFFPYLVSVSSEYDNINPSFMMEKEITYEQISSKLGMEVNQNTEFNIIEKTQSGRVKKIEINNKVYNGTDFRNILGLRSTDFDIIKNEKSITFVTRGYGHGVGLSQYGANGMAKNGYNYIQILNNYYPGTILNHL